MSHDETENSVSTRIRYYIYGLLRKNGDRSVPVPSSYKLAQEFDTTRSIVRYELEKLIASGALVSRHRIGTFTNPLSNYAQHVLLDDHMPLVGVMYDNGDLFTYAATAAKTMSALFSELADANCYIHDLRRPPQSDNTVPKDITAFEMDGFIWAGSRDMSKLSQDFLGNLAGLPCPAVTVGALHPALGGVSVDPAGAARELAELCRREQRRRILVITLNGKFTELLNEFQQAADGKLEIHTIRGEAVRDVFDEARDFIARETPADCVLCDGAFAKAISAQLCEKGVDIATQCRIAALSDFNGESAFTGVIVQTPFTELACNAVELLKTQITTGVRTAEHRRIPLQLKYRNLP